MKIEYSRSCWNESVSIDCKDNFFYFATYFSSNEEGEIFRKQCVDDFDNNKMLVFEILEKMVSSFDKNDLSDTLDRLDISDLKELKEKLKNIQYKEFTFLINELIWSTSIQKNNYEEDDCDQCGSSNITFSIFMED